MKNVFFKVCNSSDNYTINSQVLTGMEAPEVDILLFLVDFRSSRRGLKDLGMKLRSDNCSTTVV